MKFTVTLVLLLWLSLGSTTSASARLAYGGGILVPASHWAYPLCLRLIEHGLIDLPADKFSGKPELSDTEFAEVTVQVFTQWRTQVAQLREQQEHSVQLPNPELDAREQALEDMHKVALALMVEFGTFLDVTDVEKTQPGGRLQPKADLIQRSLDLGDIEIDQIWYLLPSLAVGQEFSAYDEVPADHWAYSALSKLVTDGVCEGYPEDYFDGNTILTRYEFAQAIARIEDSINTQEGFPQDVMDLALRLRIEFGDELLQF